MNYPSNRPISGTYASLIYDTHKVSTEAATYLINRAMEIPEFSKNDKDDTIDNIFVWESTPQGQDFWEDISKKIEALYETR